MHPQHGLLVVDVHAGMERKVGDGRRVDVDEAPASGARSEVAAASLAPLAEAVVGLVETPTWSAPLQTFTLSGFHSVNPLTGLALHDLHELQWQ